MENDILYQFMNIRAIPPEAVPAFVDSLPPLRREKILSLREERKRLQSLAAGLVSRNLLASVGISDDLLAYEESGKPYIQNRPEWHISISHSGQYAVCAVSRSPVAVDIQRHGGIYQAILSSGYTPKEREFCVRARNREQAFYDLWCRKECKAKLRPYAHLREIDALTAEPGFQYWKFSIPGYGGALYGAWNFICMAAGAETFPCARDTLLPISDTLRRPHGLSFRQPE
ncbi:MAG: 4'-phosphopantetheinyl transferase superfamily protein [Oscillibacter sp.]|nr:4'-phosphopantetheinyl transferase superfamily protein [Oscillibacter sp.]